MTLTASRRLYALGAIILVALVTCSRSEFGTPSFLVGLAIAGIAYLLAVREFFQTQAYPRRVIFACLALAALWRIPFLMSRQAQMTTSTDTCGMGACSGSAIILTI